MTRAARLRGTPLSAAAVVSAVKDGKELGLKATERSTQHFPARNHDDIDAELQPMSPKHLSGEAFRPVANDGGPEFPGRRNPQPGSLKIIGHEEHGHQLAVDTCAGFVRALEIRPFADPRRSTQSECLHRTESTTRAGITFRQRPSAACGPSHADASERCDRSSSPCGQENHAPLPGAWCWADMCVYPSWWSRNLKIGTVPRESHTTCSWNPSAVQAKPQS